MTEIKTPDLRLMLDIQKADYQLSLYLDEISSIPSQQKAEEAAFEKKKSAWQAALNKTKELRLLQRQAELNIEELIHTIEKYQIQTHEVKDNEAYKALLRQIENAQKSKDETETQALLLLDSIEEAEAEEKKQKDILALCEKDKNAAIQKLSDRQKQLEAFAEAERQKKASLKAKLTDIAIFEQYEALYLKRGKTIFMVQENNGKYFCPRCSMSLTSQTIGSLKKPNTFAICPNCFAWLCLKEDNL